MRRAIPLAEIPPSSDSGALTALVGLVGLALVLTTQVGLVLVLVLTVLNLAALVARNLIAQVLITLARIAPAVLAPTVLTPTVLPESPGSLESAESPWSSRLSCTGWLWLWLGSGSGPDSDRAAAPDPVPGALAVLNRRLNARSRTARPLGGGQFEGDRDGLGGLEVAVAGVLGDEACAGRAGRRASRWPGRG